jgi:hypothetical protein
MQKVSRDSYIRKVVHHIKNCKFTGFQKKKILVWLLHFQICENDHNSKLILLIFKRAC